MERRKTLKNGGIVQIRHVSRDDGPALKKALNKTTASDMRSRFFSSGKEFDLNYLQLLTNVDQEREIALFAVNPNDTNDIWAGGRLYIDPASLGSKPGAIQTKQALTSSRRNSELNAAPPKQNRTISYVAETLAMTIKFLCAHSLAFQ